MVSTVVDICNMALIRLGSERIISLDDASKPALLCKQMYEQTRDEVLVDFPWPSSVTRAELAQLSEDPVYGYTYVYALPTNPYCLRVLDASDEDLDYRIEGRKLYRDSEEVAIRYIFKNVDPTTYETALAEAISIRLASKLAYALPNKQSMRMDLLQEYVVILRHARGLAAKESRQDGIDQSTYWEDEL